MQFLPVKILLSTQHILNDRFIQLNYKISTDFPVLSTLTSSKLYVCEQLTPRMYIAAEWFLYSLAHE